MRPGANLQVMPLVWRPRRSSGSRQSLRHNFVVMFARSARRLQNRQVSAMTQPFCQVPSLLKCGLFGTTWAHAESKEDRLEATAAGADNADRLVRNPAVVPVRQIFPPAVCRWGFIGAHGEQRKSKSLPSRSCRTSKIAHWCNCANQQGRFMGCSSCGFAGV